MGYAANVTLLIATDCLGLGAHTSASFGCIFSLNGALNALFVAPSNLRLGYQGGVSGHQNKGAQAHRVDPEKLRYVLKSS